MSHRVLLATNNAKKLTELRRIVIQEGMELDVLTPGDLPGYPEPAEDEWTFEGNALIKARAGASHSGLPTLADDSGICVAALNQMPGVRSSRWAGAGHDDQANLELLLRQVDDVAPARRQASFVAAMALVMPDGREFTVRGEMTGHLSLAPVGTNGFGYDPIFVPDDQPDPDHGLTTAQMDPASKDAISHRDKAIRAILPILAEALKETR